MSLLGLGFVAQRRFTTVDGEVSSGGGGPVKMGLLNN